MGVVPFTKDEEVNADGQRATLTYNSSEASAANQNSFFKVLYCL